MSTVFWIGLAILAVGILFLFIAFISEDSSYIVIPGFFIGIFLGFPCIVAGLIDTSIQLDKAKSGYILEKSEHRIEVIQRKENFIQFKYDDKLLIVNRNDWINNYANGAKIVNIKNF